MEAFFSIALFFFAGLVSGAFGGLLGLGGSTILVPILVLAMGLPMHLVIAIGLMNNVVVSSSAVLRYHSMGLIHKKTVLIMNLGSIPGIVAGTLIASSSTESTIKVIFGIFLIIAIVQAFIKKGASEKEPIGEPDKVNVKGLSLLGMVMGTLGALLGIGGGVIAVPAQTSLFGIPLKNAIANSLGTIIAASTLGAIVYFYVNAGSLFRVDEALLIIAAVAPGSVIGSWIGAWSSEKIPTKTIKYLFYITMIYISFNMLKSGLGF